jgi:hypothetical protein
MTALLAFTNQGQLVATFAIIAALAVLGGLAVWRGWGV